MAGRQTYAQPKSSASLEFTCGFCIRERPSCSLDDCDSQFGRKLAAIRVEFAVKEHDHVGSIGEPYETVFEQLSESSSERFLEPQGRRDLDLADIGLAAKLEPQIDKILLTSRVHDLASRNCFSRTW